MTMENIVGQTPKQLDCNWANSSGKGQAHLENMRKKDKQLILWVGSSPNSSGTGPAHPEKRQLIEKQVQKIN